MMNQAIRMAIRFVLTAGKLIIKLFIFIGGINVMLYVVHAKIYINTDVYRF